MPPTIAVAHYPEGAGHATRMLAIANAIENGGGSVRMAGGGAGTEFVALNGYDEFEPTTVDYVDTYQGGSVWQAARRSLPASLGRIADYQAWLSATDPDALVTDDMFAAMAASRSEVPLYVLKHDMPELYDDPIERAGARFHTRFQLSAAREFFYPVVWPESSVDPANATRIPPVALDGTSPVEDGPDVVVVPSHYSSLSHVADHLRRQGYDVLDVADDDWDPVPSLLPYIREADAVVCSGYSTIMDAAVAGTPCIIQPETDEQDAVAEWIEHFDVTGFTVADQPIDVLNAVADPPSVPTFENGAEFIAETVLNDLQNPDPYAESTEAADTAGDEVTKASRVGSLLAVPTLAAAFAATATMSVAPSRLRRRLGEGAARFVGLCRAGVGRIRRASGTAGHRSKQAVLTAAKAVADGTRATGERTRHGMAGAAEAVSTKGSRFVGR
jgi:hypothetical protein